MRQCRLPLAASIAALTAACLLARPVQAAERLDAAAPACPACIADFALYDPATEDDGVWEEDVTALESIFSAYGFTWRKVDAAGIARGVLGRCNKRRFPALAAARGPYNGYGWYQSYPYNLRLFDGAGAGPFGWTPWRNGTFANFVEVAIDTANPTMRTIGLPARPRFLYGGGPWFEPRTQLPGWEVWAHAVAPAGVTSRAGDGKPTIVRFAYGKGTAILFAYHPEVLIGSNADGMVMRYPYDEGAIDWNTGNQSLDQIALDSWNVVHAALQIAAGRPVTPIPELPDA